MSVYRNKGFCPSSTINLTRRESIHHGREVSITHTHTHTHTVE